TGRAHSLPPTMSDRVRIVRVGPPDWASWRDLRLSALSDAPSAFGSTYGSQLAKTETEWRDRLDPANGVALIATADACRSA
ncbi:MAG: hypothetical protein ACRD0W_11585, partial [Acidimicrobiales bacterium]